MENNRDNEAMQVEEEDTDAVLDEYPGQYCKARNYTLRMLQESPKGEIVITNGVVADVYNYLKKIHKSNVVPDIIKLCGYTYCNSKLVNTVRMGLTRVNTKRKILRGGELDTYLNMPFRHYTLCHGEDSSERPRSQSSSSSSSSSPTAKPVASVEGDGPSSSHQTNGVMSDEETDSVCRQCCLIYNDERCEARASNVELDKKYCKLVWKYEMGLLRDEQADHNHICNYHYNLIKNQARQKEQKKKKRPANQNSESKPEIDFSRIPVRTLKRIQKHLKLSREPVLSKSQLAQCLQEAFKTWELSRDEVVETCTFFIYKAKKELEAEGKIQHKDRKMDTE